MTNLDHAPTTPHQRSTVMAARRERIGHVVPETSIEARTLVLRFLMLRPAFGLLYQRDLTVLRHIRCSDLGLDDHVLADRHIESGLTITVLVGRNTAVMVQGGADSTRISILAHDPMDGGAVHGLVRATAARDRVRARSVPHRSTWQSARPSRRSNVDDGRRSRTEPLGPAGESVTSTASRRPSDPGVQDQHHTPDPNTSRATPTRARRSVRVASRTIVAAATVVAGLAIAACAPVPLPPVPGPNKPISTTTSIPNERCPLGAPASPYFSFLAVEDGCPVRWNPCRPIPWWFNPTGAVRPLSEIHAAFEQVANASGLTFEYRGATTRRSREWFESWEGYGLVVDFAEIPGSVVGLGGIAWSMDGVQRGMVQLDPTMMTSPNPVEARRQWLDLTLHEIGHAVGLHHVDHRSERMYPMLTDPFHGTFGGGDLQGLRHVGREQGCAGPAAQTSDAPVLRRVVAE